MDSAFDTANAFFRETFQFHSLPDSIISHRDPKFTSTFWDHLMNLCDVKLGMSSSHHPQSDGTSQIMNSMVENFCVATVRSTRISGTRFYHLPSSSSNRHVWMSRGIQPWTRLGLEPIIAFGYTQQKPPSSMQIVETLKESLQSCLREVRFSHEMA